MHNPATTGPGDAWRVTVLGGLRAARAGRRLDRFQTQKTASLFAFLALHRDRAHAREDLYAMLWPDADDEAGRNRLSQAISWLRSQLEPAGTPRGAVLLTDRFTVAVNPQHLTTDAAEFEAALRRAAAEPERAPELLRGAVSLYGGDLLPGHYDDWVLAERQRLRVLVIGAMRRLAAHHAAAADWGLALDYARQANAADPLDEEVACELIDLLARAGQRSLALRQSQELETALRDQLDLAPSPDTVELAERIRREAPAAPREPRAAVPAPITRLFGRHAQLGQVRALLCDERARLVTLTGPAGAGKTRLALEAASRLAGHYAGGIWFMPLVDLRDARLLPGVLIDLLGVARGADNPSLAPAIAALEERLGGRPGLLVMDNLEHLVEEAGPQVIELLERIPTLDILTTSRRRLNLQPERELAVPPLRIPEPSADASRLAEVESAALFVDRARAVRPNFEITEQNATAVAELCRRLEGLPLSIELCAAWAQTLTPAQMLEQLERRFDLLVSRRTDISARHRSLRAAIEYSFLLLPPALQQGFVRLSVFRGGWTLEAATAVWSEAGPPASSFDVLTALTELRERSLITADETAPVPGEPEMRFYLLETLREFAAEQRTLAIEPELRARHARFFLDLAEMAGRQVEGPEQRRWMTRVEMEQENLRAALAGALANRDDEVACRLCVALGHTWIGRGHAPEGEEWVRKALALGAGRPRSDEQLLLRARTLTTLGFLLRARADFPGATEAANEALALAEKLGAAVEKSDALNLLGTMAALRGDYAEAKLRLTQGLELLRQTGSTERVPSALVDIGNVAMEEHDWDRAWELYTDSIAHHRRAGNMARAAGVMNNQALVARYRGDLATALAILEEALTISGQLAANSANVALLQLNLSTVLRLLGRLPDALQTIRSAMTAMRKADERRPLAWCVKETGHIACARGDFAAGICLLSASERARESLGMSFHPADPEELHRDRARALSMLGEKAFEERWTAGHALALDAAVEEAMDFASRSLPA